MLFEPGIVVSKRPVAFAGSSNQRTMLAPRWGGARQQRGMYRTQSTRQSAPRCERIAHVPVNSIRADERAALCTPSSIPPPSYKARVRSASCSPN